MTAPRAIVAIDAGGTHVRFARAEVAGGRVRSLGPATLLRTADHAGLADALAAYAAASDTPLPRAAGIAVAGPIQDEALKLTNSPWTICPVAIGADLGLDRVVLVNDFGAVAHAVMQVGTEHLRHLCGPDRYLPDDGVIGVVGPGTGLGVAQILRHGGGYAVVETEGGHVGFAPADALEDRLLATLRARHGRVSAERIVSGSGLIHIHAALAAIDGRAVPPRDDVALWTAALDGGDALAAAALDRFCLALGAVAGDIALAQGARAMVIAGGVGQRLADRLPASGFAARFVAKGRLARRMGDIPVKLVTHPQPGLYGAAAAFAQACPDV